MSAPFLPPTAAPTPAPAPADDPMMIALFFTVRVLRTGSSYTTCRVWIGRATRRRLRHRYHARIPEVIAAVVHRRLHARAVDGTDLGHRGRDRRRR